MGGNYSLLGFKPYLDRGYNTRLGWQGQPVNATDPHLYFYARESLALLAELEYLQSEGRVHTQILKVYAPRTGLTARHWQELEYFALEASGGRLDTDTLHALIDKNCQKEWRHGSLSVALVVEPQTLWLRISDRLSEGLPALNSCLGKKSKNS